MPGTTAAAKEASAVKKAPAKKATKAQAASTDAANATNATNATKKAAAARAKEPKEPKDAQAPTASKETVTETATATADAKSTSPAVGGLRARMGQPARKPGGSYVGDEKFLASQHKALDVERSTYVEQATSLRAEADSLVEEMEPGDVQFDEESGEGGTVAVDRERDLALSAQALEAVEEIDHALAKVAAGTYGVCENCGALIPKNRLEALPFARLCITCKAGGLSRR
jgi:DnaK suppressor protein